jgi:PGF-CTERM protein
MLAAMLVVAAVAPAGGAAAAAAQADGNASAYAGTHVSFDLASNAVTNYTVGGVEMVESIRVGAAGDSSTSGSAGLLADTSLSVATDLLGTSVSVTARAETTATLKTESGATLAAHDNPRGSLVVTSGNGSQVLYANVSGDASASNEGDARVVVERDGATGVFIAVGNASVGVTDEGDVSARVGEDGRIVFRTYTDGRTESDRRAEALIANGTATAQVYVGAQNGSTTTDVVRYGSNTTVEVTERADGTVTMTVERPVHNGTVVLTSVSDSVLDASGDLTVSVDGEAAARTSSYAALRSATNGGDQSAYLVVEESADASADARTNVYVALNHFSERTVTMQSSNSTGETSTTETSDGGETTDGEEADGETADGGSGGESTSTSAPGFGVTASLAALVGAALVAVRRA